MKHIIIIWILLISTSSFGQDTTYSPKTFKSVEFEVNDKLLAPRIYFSTSGGSYVLPEHNDSVKVIADFLIDNPTMEIEIGVHTDFRGVAESNIKLSERRAISVKYLLRNRFKIQLDRMKTKGYGESEPIIAEEIIKAAGTREEKEKLHAINRRVEIIILKK